MSTVCCCISKVNEESSSQKLLSTLQRCFKAVDSAECGFIPASCLTQVLHSYAYKLE